MDQKQEYIQYDIADIIMEKPLIFSIGKKVFDIYPVTLGKSYLLQRLIDGLDMKEDNLDANPFLEVLRVCKEKKDVVLKIVAYSVLKKKKDLFDERKIQKVISIFKEVDEEDLAKLLLFILTSDKVDSCIKHFGIDKDRKEQQKVLKVKNKDSNVITFGGHSIYGSLIDVVCERYGWTMDYVVWGISYANLRMLIADMTTSISLTDEEKKSARVRTNGSFINGDDPANLEKMKAMFPD